MKTIASLLIFSFLIIGCSFKQDPGITVRTEFVKFPLPTKYDPATLPIKLHKQKIDGVDYILFQQDDFIDVYNRYEAYKNNYNNLYNSILNFNNLK